MSLFRPLVGKGGLEPPRLSAHDPKSCSSANSDTSPRGTTQYNSILRQSPQTPPLHMGAKRPSRPYDRERLSPVTDLPEAQASTIARSHRKRCRRLAMGATISPPGTATALFVTSQERSASAPVSTRDHPLCRAASALSRLLMSTVPTDETASLHFGDRLR